MTADLFNRLLCPLVKGDTHNGRSHMLPQRGVPPRGASIQCFQRLSEGGECMTHFLRLLFDRPAGVGIGLQYANAEGVSLLTRSSDQVMDRSRESVEGYRFVGCERFQEDSARSGILRIVQKTVARGLEDMHAFRWLAQLSGLLRAGQRGPRGFVPPQGGLQAPPGKFMLRSQPVWEGKRALSYDRHAG